MGLKDTATVKYMRQNAIFADAFNYFVYDGKQVIDPDSLEELDTREIELPYGGETGAKQPVQKTRDVIKSVTAMTDKKTAYLVLAIENQSNIHYAMPVKNLVYDALQYSKQVEKAVSSHKHSGDYKRISPDEYLSQFLKSDHLMPVITLVIYFDAKPWDGPMSVHEMFLEQSEQILAFVPDYRINLIAPEAIKDKDFNKFKTTLKEVLSFIKYSRDADELSKLLNSDVEFQRLGRDEVDVLNACVNAKLTMQKDEEVLNVCLAIQTMNQRAREDGQREGRKEGRKEGQVESLLRCVKSLMHSTGMSAEQAMDALAISEDDRKLLFSATNTEFANLK